MINTNKFKLVILFILIVFKMNSQCSGSYGSIVISEIYFDTHYAEDIESKYHSFGEYIELYNSSDQDIDLRDWILKDNHTQYKFSSNDVDGNNLVIQAGGFKIVTYNGFYYSNGQSGLQSAIGGREKFKELFASSSVSLEGNEHNIILQNQIVLYNEADKISLFTPEGKLIDEVSYSNESGDVIFNPTPLDYMQNYGMQSQNYTIIISPRIDNGNGGRTNEAIGAITYYDPIDPLTPITFYSNSYRKVIQRPNVNDYYTDGGDFFQVGISTPLSFPPGLNVPTRPIDPFLYYIPINDDNYNKTESFSYDIKSGLIDGYSKSYFDDLGKPTVTVNQDFKNSLVWGSETLYDSFGRKSKESFPAPTCLGMTKVDFLSNSFMRTTFLDKYYGNNNDLEEYQATAEQPFTEINYDKLNPGNVINVVGGNQINGDWKTGYTFTVPAAQEMYYVYGKDYYDGPIDANGEEVITKFYKTTSVDANGIENVVFTDGEGKTLASARSGGTASYPVMAVIGSQGYIDVHIPSEPTGTGVGTIFGFSSINDFKVFDLKTGNQIPSSFSLPAGNAYRIVANTIPTVDPKVYITSSGSITSPNAMGIAYNVNYYDYAINIYDKTGRPFKSVQPNAFAAAFPAAITIQAVPAYMQSSATSFISTVEYNTLGQVIVSTSPDEGTSKFAYRHDGQIRYSQSALQAQLVNGFYRASYTNYDTYGRPIESGVLASANASIWSLLQSNVDNAELIPTGLTATLSERTFSVYDDTLNISTFATSQIPTPYSLDIPSAQSLSTLLGPNLTNYTQKNLSGNVAITYKADAATINAITWYSYDIYGRVEWIVQYNDGFGNTVKTIDYEYDYKGNVAKVWYQKNQPDQFVHRYTYDINNAITMVETADATNMFTVDAEYTYYKTGELKRTNIAQGGQGLDYIYTLGGMLKSINHPSLNPANDPGKDGVTIPSQPTTAPDLFGISLDYYQGDYQRLNTQGVNNFQTDALTGNDYVGNIKATRWANKSLDVVGSNIQPKAYKYNYNRNNWLTDATFGNSNATGHITSFSPNPNSHYEGNLDYDANGNIITLNRADKNGLFVDQLGYQYGNNNNQLLQLVEAGQNPTSSNDFNPVRNGTITYTYNAIGQLTHDSEQNIDYIYNTQGLVTEVKRNNTTLVKFYYNERGHRIKKESFNTSGVSTDYYVLDVSGNAMSIYTKPAGGSITQTDRPIYGITRLGVFKKDPNNNNQIRSYQITDHLGNVRGVINRTNQSQLLAMLSSYADYYPFGEQLDGRNSNSANYRYAFQGQEKDPETGMEAFELRLWDGRLGRWLSPDPKHQYASPYLGMGNNPISLIDPDGGSTNDFYKNNTTGAIEWFDGSGAIDGYEHLGVSFSFTDAFNNVTAWGESRFGSIVSWDQKDGFFHHNYTLDEVVISRSPKSDFYYLDIYRDTETSRSTTSTFSFRDIDGYFLEPAGADTRRSGMDRRIPEGDYNLTSHSSKKYPNHFKLYNDEVSQSRAILIHPGNSPAHTLGCLLPGSSRSTDFVGGSKSKYLQLKNAINEVGVKNVVVRIHNNINNVP